MKEQFVHCIRFKTRQIRLGITLKLHVSVCTVKIALQAILFSSLFGRNSSWHSFEHIINAKNFRTTMFVSKHKLVNKTKLIQSLYRLLWKGFLFICKYVYIVLLHNFYVVGLFFFNNSLCLEYGLRAEQIINTLSELVFLS